MESIEKTMQILELDIGEIDKLYALSKRDAVQKLLEDYKKNLYIALQNEKKNYDKNKKKIEASENDAMAYVTVTKYAFLDSEKFAKVYLSDIFVGLDKHPKEKIKSTFKSDGFDIKILDWKGKNYRYAIKYLSNEIIPEESYFKLTGNGMTIFLKKLKQDQWYGSLELKN